MAAEQQLVNLQELDRLVLGFLAAPEGEAAASDAALAAEVEALVLGGAAGAALERLRAARLALLDNQRLLFTLQQWHFLDLAGSADPEHHKRAIALVRAELAPLALTAFPEAYAELKHSMLQLLILPPSPTGRSGAGLPPPPISARREAASMLGRTVREVLGVRQQPLSVLLRYLLLVHAQHKKDPAPALARPASGGPAGAGRAGGSSGAAAQPAAGSGAGRSSNGGGAGTQPTVEPSEAAAAAAAGNEDEALDAECRRLLLAWRDPMPLPRESMDGAPARFPEAQVQALRTSLGCDREEAVALMRQSGGDVSTALCSAVQATRLDEPAVQQLAQQYAIFRGLDFAAPLVGAQHLDPPAQANGAAAVGSAANGALAPAAEGSGVQVPSSAAAAQQPMPQPAGPGAAWVGHSAGEAHPAKMPRRSALDPSIGLAARQAAAAAAAAAIDRPQQGADAADEGRLRTGSVEAAGPPAAPAPMPATAMPNAGGKRSAPEPPEPVPMEMEGWEEAAPSVPSTSSMSEREVHDAVARLRWLLAQGLLDEAEQLLQGLSPGFAQRFPEAAFLMRRCQLLRLLGGHGGQDTRQCGGAGAAEGGVGMPQAAATAGGATAALAFVRSHLSPLAQQHPQLQPLLKSSLAALLPATGLPSTSSSPAPPALDLPAAVAQAAAAVHTALQQQFQIREPRLLRLLGHLLVGHSAHFMAQRCKDGFERELGIPQLRGPGVVPAAEQQWRSTRQAAAAGGGGGGLLSALLARRRSQDGGRTAAAVIVESSSDEELPLSPYRAAPAAPPGQREQVARLVHEAEALMERMQRLPHLALEVVEADEMEEDQEEEEGGSEDGLGVREEDEGWQHAGQPGGGGNGDHAGGVGVGVGGGVGGGEGGDGGGAEGVSEEAILLTQEFSGLPRRQAIELLLVFGGSPQAVMAHLFP